MDSPLERLLRLVALYNIKYYLLWTKKLEFYLNVNDVFRCAADVENVPLTHETIDALANALKDTEGEEYEGIMLFASRNRKLRPQPVVHKRLKYKHLFDVCGPEREDLAEESPRCGK